MARVTKKGEVLYTEKEWERLNQRNRSEAYYVRKILRMWPNEILEELLESLDENETAAFHISRDDIKAALDRKILKGQS